MRITVFGATGGIGQEVVGQALAAGHEVTAVVRDPDRLPASQDRAALHAVVRLDDPAAVRAAVAGRSTRSSAASTSSPIRAPARRPSRWSRPTLMRSSASRVRTAEEPAA
ncbi:NAD(P)H-binding protein [Streptomyces sp. ID01-9D]|nr:NAD(P)H-binding protein [Streptomyces sp. ID01-9D]